MSGSKIITVLGDGTAATNDISGTAFNPATKLKFAIYGSIETTTKGHVIFYAGGTNLDETGGLYIAATREAGTAYGIDMSLNTIYKLVNTRGGVYYNTPVMVPTSGGSAVYSSSRVYMVQSIAVDPTTDDIYFWSLQNTNNVGGYVMVIPYNSHTNSFSKTTLDVGKVTMLYSINGAQSSYSMRVHPDGHLFIALFQLNKLLVLPNIASGTSITLYNSTIASPNSYSYTHYTSTSTDCYITLNSSVSDLNGVQFDNYTNLYYVNNSTEIYVITTTQQTLFNISVNANTPTKLVDSPAYCLAFDSSNTLFIADDTNKKIKVVSSYTSVMGYSVTANTVTELSIPSNSFSSLLCLIFDKETRQKLYIAGGDLYLRQIINPPSPPSYITITPLTYPSILIGNLQNQPMYLYNGGNTITGYYYSTTNTPTYTFVPITTQESFAITRPTSAPYAINVKSVNSVGNSQVYTITAALAVPGIPSVQANCLSTGSISVIITPPLEHGETIITDYDVYYGLINTVVSRTPVSTTTGTTYSFSGLSANTYTVYVAAKNIAGWSPYGTANVAVYTIPSNAPTIDPGNTKSNTPGNLTVSFTDTSNTALNNITYVYYLYDASSGSNQYANTFYYSDSPNTLESGITQYSFAISGLVNKSYLVYLRAKNQYGFSSNSAPYSATAYVPPSNISFDTGNTSIVTAGNLKVTINDPTNVLQNRVYYVYSIDGGTTYANSNIPNNGPTKTSYTFYVPYTPTAIKPIYVKAQNTVGASSAIGMNIYSPYNPALYNTTNQFFIDNVTNYAFTQTGLSNKMYGVYLRSKNPIGDSTETSHYDVTVYTTPENSISIDAGNTKPVANGNLQVSITDSSNVALNGVYYEYSLNGTNYTATNVTANSVVKTTPYTFFIPTTDISNTIYVRATNPVGNSSPPASRSVIVYQHPKTPSVFTASLVSSGNVLLTVRESLDYLPTNYFLNGVSYYYYVYTEGTGTNFSGNTAVYTNLIGNVSNSAYPDTTLLVSGLPNATSTFYMIAKNDVGYSNTVSANITVYTGPSNIQIDTGNTKVVSSGNVRVVVYDPFNTTANNVFYRYSTDGSIPSIEANIRKIDGQPYPSFYVDGLGNDTYTISVLAYNTVGNSAVVSGNVVSYLTPSSISVDASNTRVVSSGNLLIQWIDVSNTAKGNVYYWYSLNGSPYINSNVTATTPSTSPYSFYVSGLTDISYSVSVIANNPIGNSAVSTISKIVYTTPVSPTAYSVAFIQSGNIRASFTDINANPNYESNGVSYSYYLYSSGTNQSGNMLAYTSTNIPFSKTVSTYGFDIDNLSANAYTLYVIAKNTVGNSSPLSYTLSVYTNPLPPNEVSVSSTVSGNLRVNIVDTSNTAINDISYYYYLYVHGTANDSGNTEAYTNSNTQYVASNTTFYVNGLSPNNYTVYVRAKNTLGFSANTSSSSQTVYATPATPQIDDGNTASTNSGEITVSVLDASNLDLNNVYYHYSIDNGNTYSNSFTRYTGTAVGNLYSYVITGLTNGQSYTVYTIAKNTLGNSAPIATAPIVPFATPNPPTIAATPEDSTITIAITPPANNGNAISSYSYSISPQINTFIHLGIPVDNTFTIGNLQNGTIYDIRVIATNARGNSTPSAPVSAKPFGVSGAPVIYAKYRNNIIDVSFDTPDSNGTEIINYRYSLNGVFPPTGNVGIPPDNYFSIRYLTIGNTYVLRLHAESTVGLSPPSNAITLNPGTVPDEPIIVNTIPLDGGIEIELLPGFNGGSEILEYEYAYIEGFL